MKVLHIFNSLMPSGAETMWTAAGPFLAQRGVETHVLATMPELGPYADKMRAAGFAVHHIPRRGHPYLQFRFWRGLYRLVKSGRFDAVQVHTEGGRFMMCVVCRLAGVKSIVSTFHSVFVFTGWRKLRRTLVRRILAWMGVVEVAIGESVLKNEARYGCRAELIWNWLDTSRMTTGGGGLSRGDFGLKASDKVVVAVGNCNRVKNHRFLLEVMAHLPSGYVLLHVGRESAEMDERSYAKELGVDGRVRFLGVRNDVAEILRLADVFAMPSLREGVSISCLEALWCGAPCVVAESAGLVDLAARFRLCRAVPLEVAPWVGKIVEMANATDAEKGAAKAFNQALVTRDFSLETGVSRYVELWQRRGSAG